TKRPAALRVFHARHLGHEPHGRSRRSMNARAPLPIRGARGMVLITTLLLLVVVTLLGLAMFRGVGLQTRVAGNVMDKQRALQAATSTEGYGEQWLVNNVGTTTLAACSGASFGASP